MLPCKRIRASLWLSGLACAALPPAVLAVDAACKPILDANRAKFAAPALHDKKFDPKQPGVPFAEFIKVGKDAWMKAENQWMKISPGMLQTMQNFDPDGFGMHNCKLIGPGLAGTRPAKIYTWDLKVAGKRYTGSKVWIGLDGLPYKEAGDGYTGTMSYTGVVAPKAGT